MKSKLFSISLKKSLFLIILGILFLVIGIANLLIGAFSFTTLIVLGFGIALLAFFALPLFNGGYLKNFNETLSKSGLSMEQVEADLAGAEHFKNFELGRKFGLLLDQTPRLVVLRDIIWAHGVNTTTTHKLYGLIPVGKSKSYSVKLVCRDRTEVDVPVAKEPDSSTLINAIKARVPGVVIGYSDEIANIMKTNFQAAVQHVDEKNAAI